jgi:predicted kinase
VPFLGVWLEAPVETLLPRLAARRNDPSDANADVLLAQMQRDCGRIAWHRLDAGAPAAQTGDRVLGILNPARP